MRMTHHHRLEQRTNWKEKSNPSSSSFCKNEGLELSPAKTVITTWRKGFDFPRTKRAPSSQRKMLIKPSKKNVNTFLGGIRKTIRAARGMSAADLIRNSTPSSGVGLNYHRHVVSTRAFARVITPLLQSCGNVHDEDTRTEHTLAQKTVLCDASCRDWSSSVNV